MEVNVPTRGFISDLISQEIYDVAEGISALKASVAASNSSERRAYVSLNPDFYGP